MSVCSFVLFFKWNRGKQKITLTKILDLDHPVRSAVVPALFRKAIWCEFQSFTSSLNSLVLSQQSAAMVPLRQGYLDPVLEGCRTSGFLFYWVANAFIWDPAFLGESVFLPGRTEKLGWIYGPPGLGLDTPVLSSCPALWKWKWLMPIKQEEVLRS